MESRTESPLPIDPVVEAYKKDVDRTLIRQNLRLTPEERLLQLHRLRLLAEELRRAGERLIEVKRAAGRPKDLESIAELEAILDERSKT